MSDLRALVLSGHIAEAAEVLASLTEPQTADLTWGGYALLILGQRPQAELLLRRASAQGGVQARIFLTVLELEQGALDRAQALLDAAEPELSGPEEEAMYWRERARLLTVRGESREAVMNAALRAWDACALAAPAIQVAVAQYLGFLWTYYDEPAAALPYLEFAQEQALPHQLDAVRLTTAEALLDVGRPEEARQQWQAIESPLYAWNAQLLEANDLSVRGDVAGALALLEDLSAATWPHPRSEVVILRQLLSVQLLLGSPQFGATLARARHLTLTPYDEQFLDSLEGLALARAGAPGGLPLLRRVAEQQEAAGAGQGAVLTRLALAACEPQATDAHLGRAAELAAALPLSLRRRQLRAEQYGPLLSGAVTALQARPPGDEARQLLLSETPGPALRLSTLGRGELVRNGEAVRLRMTRTPEILAYLLLNGPARLPELLLDLFPEVPAARAQNYFHQLRSDLAARVPEVQITYHKGTRLYRLETAAPLVWDVAEVRAHLQGEDVDAGGLLGLSFDPFLPQADSEWAASFRQQLSDEVVQAGMTGAHDLLRRGEAESALRLSEKLLALDPLSPALLALSVQAEAAAHGPDHARQRLHRARQVALQELGEVPAELTGDLSD